jgi:hypothetical protein
VKVLAMKNQSADERETLAKLSDKLRHKVGKENLITLMHRSTEELPTLALCLAKLFMLESLSERAFEEAFRCFTELLSQTTLSAGAIDLAEQVSERLNSTQLSQMNQALKTHQREEKVELRLERLRLKEAYLRLREGDTETELQALSSEAASKQALNTLRGEVGTLHEDHVQVATQCKRALSGQ